MKLFKYFGVTGLAITITLNLVARFIFKMKSAVFFSGPWWGGWGPNYVVWLVFTLIGSSWRKKR